jgi:signal recognition particle GTPase
VRAEVSGTKKPGEAEGSRVEVVMPKSEPVSETYVSGNREQEEEAEAKAAALDDLAEDRITPSMLRDLLAVRDAQLEKQSQLISQLVAKVGALAVPKSAERDSDEYLQAQTRKMLAGRTSVKIILQLSENPALNFPVFVSVNGIPMEFPRGQVVDVPVAYVEALANARVEGHQRLVTPDGDTEVVPIKYSRFPFTVWQ